MDEELLRYLQGTAEAEQKLASFTAFAKMLMTYRQAMLTAGFSPTEAWELTRDYYRLMVSKSLWPNDAPWIS